MRRGELDRLAIPAAPLDVLAQQIVAEVAAQDWAETELFDRLRRAWPYRTLARADFDAVVRILAEGFATRVGRRGALLHRDAIHGVLRGRRGARTTALTSGGAIPDTADYQVLLEPENHVIGSVNEDFAVESLSGDVFQLGNASYRILRVERGTVRVEDAKGQPPNLPFWLGEAPGRTDALSGSVSRLRAEAEARLRADPSGGALRTWLMAEIGVGAPAAEEIAGYLSAGLAALGVLPTQEVVALERFFDESGGMQLVVHSPYGSRLNRAWGLALRKRFCRKFNFEIQAAATEDAIVLSLTAAHSFALEDVPALSERENRPAAARAGDARRADVRRALALGGGPFAGVAALPLGQEGAPADPRMQAEDLIAAVFPDQIACFENLTGDREVPDHPLVSSGGLRLPARGHGHRGARTAAPPARIGRGPRRLPRPDAAVAAGARSAFGQTLRLPRRRAPRRAPDAGGDGAAMGGPARRFRSRPARSAGDRGGPRRGLARPGQTPRRCTTRCFGWAS